jgi:hypothetical protein
MNATHKAFLQTPIGQKISHIASDPKFLSEYKLCTRIGLPAIQASIWDIEAIIAPLDRKTQMLAAQAAGAQIGEILTAEGYRVSRHSNGNAVYLRLKKARIVKTGTVFEEPPSSANPVFAKGLEIAERAMKTYHNALSELAK